MARPYLYITRKLPDEIVDEFRNAFDVHMWPHEEIPVDEETLQHHIQKANALLTMLTDKVDENSLRVANHLKVIANLAVGYDNIDLKSARDKRIIVTNTPDVLTETTADLTFGLLLSTARRIIEANQFIKSGEWKQWSPFLMAGSEVHHKTVGIVGMGRIGSAFARRAKGFGMEILYHNRSRNVEAEQELQATYATFDDLLEQSDFVVCLAPYAANTKGMFGKRAFQKMKTSAIFINASRGLNVDETALYHALINKDIKAAGLDVFENEPINKEHPLLSLNQVVCLPHIGSATVETRERMIHLCFENIDLVLKGDRPKTPVS
ncbi:2-hydroxyacid dehydrogenase [Aquibacillus rhizosphaerae]|uniref:D-glycerate dehydrogenase n=1 Tax=Aquibacillus rhizosphaerae TaxID=3051431 RepID=A0ABT7L7U5_9BACI|nr:D-glycerate dehydrogenase [Aquibacillus sp. LR5S19]MDL4841934.1 D-glycerate dehydrogenase [Aquibacillus sp. LR5S19]